MVFLCLKMEKVKENLKINYNFVTSTIEKWELALNFLKQHYLKNEEKIKEILDNQKVNKENNENSLQDDN